VNSRRHVRVVCVLAPLLALAGPAVASPLDIVGLGSRRAGQVNAGLADVDDATALYYNPAGLANRAPCLREEEPERDTDESPDPVCAEPDRGDLVVGVALAYSHLAISGTRAPFNDAGGAQLAGRARIAERFALAFAFHGPSQGGTHAVVRDPIAPLYPYYRDRLSRPVLLVGTAIDLTDKSIGAAVDLAAGTSHPKAIVGATVRLSPSLQIGAVWRQRFAIVDEATGARVHYTPHTVLAGVTFITDAVRASVDLGFAHWSAYEGPFATGTSVRVPYKSTGQLRLGIESNKEHGIAFRFGYALESAAIPPNQPDSNLLDGFKQSVAGGASYGVGRVRIDAYVGVQIVGTRTMTEPDDTTLKSGGEIFTAGLSLAVGY
jgi:hypothetical protein